MVVSETALGVRRSLAARSPSVTRMPVIVACASVTKSRDQREGTARSRARRFVPATARSWSIDRDRASDDRAKRSFDKDSRSGDSYTRIAHDHSCSGDSSTRIDHGDIASAHVSFQSDDDDACTGERSPAFDRCDGDNARNSIASCSGTTSLSHGTHLQSRRSLSSARRAVSAALRTFPFYIYASTADQSLRSQRRHGIHTRSAPRRSKRRDCRTDQQCNAHTIITAGLHYFQRSPPPREAPSRNCPLTRGVDFAIRT